MYYGKIRENDIANGSGVRVSLFVSGCRNHCKNCFQPETWDFNYGEPYTQKTESYIIESLSRPYIQGLTLLGGEPLEPENQAVLVRLLRKVKEVYPNKDVWCYTGYTLEQAMQDGSVCRCDVTDEFLSLIDVLVDGQYVDGLRDISLKFRGSSNQRLIDMRREVRLLNKKHSVFVTLGATNHSTENREDHDYYATDPIAVKLLLDKERFSDNIWECACGEGHISKVLEQYGYHVDSTDLVDRGYGDGGVDFLASDIKYDGDIITNPPYRYAKEFVEHAIDSITEGHRVAMLLRLQFLEGKARRKLFDKYPPKYVYVFSGRINCCKNGDFSKEQRQKTGALAYAWFIWEKSFKGETIVRWFN